ncbi:MAG TPA: 3,4-dehydroadipyl-CoA semialdehyde dehydrogenase [Planctomycetota bacterium]|nr:3,4-dehydroadipyl-CoA semialdehyde dehydrogenase [Planctomycetota bacterium]
MMRLQSYLAGRWQAGEGEGSTLVDPSTEAPLAVASARGLSRAAALAHAREVGGPALRRLTLRQRGAALKALSAAIHAQREELIDIAVANAGNTRGDAKFDIDGATGTLAAYAALAADLPDRTFLADGPGLQLGRTPRFWGQHVWVPRQGVAVHVNAFNFPAWGMAEKMACALLAGMPVLEKPGTPTAMAAERIAHLIAESGALPEGSFSFLCGEAGDLLDQLGPQDVVAFTGSSGTAHTFRAHPAFARRGARLNVEADSLNAVVVGADVQPGSPTFDLLVRDTAREMTQKTGQKCTATRRILAPAPLAEALGEALAAEVSAVKVGDPREDGVRMGPLTNLAQLESVQAGIRRLAGAARVACGGPDRLRPKGCFVAPTLLIARDAGAPVFHAEEVFGPCASVLPFDGAPETAARLVALAEGGLVASVYSDDKDFAVAAALALAPWSGRLYLASERMAEHGTGAGTVLPQMVHGGPGRAGGGEELGGLRGLSLYMQRTAVQGFKSVVEGAFGNPAPGPPSAG